MEKHVKLLACLLGFWYYFCKFPPALEWAKNEGWACWTHRWVTLCCHPRKCLLAISICFLYLHTDAVLDLIFLSTINAKCMVEGAGTEVLSYLLQSIGSSLPILMNCADGRAGSKNRGSCFIFYHTLKLGNTNTIISIQYTQLRHQKRTEGPQQNCLIVCNAWF